MPRLAVPIGEAFAAAERQARHERRDYAVIHASRHGYGIRPADDWLRANRNRIVGVVAPDGTRRRTL